MKDETLSINKVNKKSSKNKLQKKILGGINVPKSQDNLNVQSLSKSYSKFKPNTEMRISNQMIMTNGSEIKFEESGKVSSETQNRFLISSVPQNEKIIPHIKKIQNFQNQLMEMRNQLSSLSIQTRKKENLLSELRISNVKLDQELKEVNLEDVICSLEKECKELSHEIWMMEGEEIQMNHMKDIRKNDSLKIKKPILAMIDLVKMYNKANHNHMQKLYRDIKDIQKLSVKREE